MCESHYCQCGLLRQGSWACRVLTPGKALGASSCITVAGDSFHPMTANLGQGGCVALEVSAKSSGEGTGCNHILTSYVYLSCT